MVVWRIVGNYDGELIPDYFNLKPEADKAYKEALARQDIIVEAPKQVRIDDRETLVKELKFAVGKAAD